MFNLAATFLNGNQSNLTLRRTVHSSANHATINPYAARAVATP
jgi:hypothetical protein